MYVWYVPLSSTYLLTQVQELARFIHYRDQFRGADATNSTQHVRRAAPMLAVATVSVATCSDIYACPYKSKDTLWYKLLLKYNNMYKNAVIRQIIVNLRQNYAFLNKIPQTPNKYPVSHGNRSGSINSTGWKKSTSD